MNRNLKTGFGLSMLVALIVGAFGVMNASAVTSGHFTSEAPGTTSLIATEATDSGHETTLTAYGTSVKCHSATYSVSSFTGTTQEITVTPSYANCTAGTNVAHVRMNGCDYKFTSRSAPNHGTTHFVCPEGKKAEVEITSGGTPSTMKFGTQTPTNGATFTTIETEGKHALTVDVTAEGIHGECHGPCVFLGTTTTSAKLTGSVTVRGTEKNNPVGITAT